MPRAKFDRSLLPERPDLSFEREIWGNGARLVAGVDEAGRGALAGPVSAGAVILPHNRPQLEETLAGVRDSKQMTPAAREGWSKVIMENALAWAVGFASSKEIDRLGIVPATRLAAKRALDELACGVEHILIDYLILPDLNIPQTPLVKGDARSLSIAAASVLAKTARDAQMVEMDALYPGYFLASNKGYATSAHREAVTKLGPCAEHRCSFSPVAEFYGLFPPKKGE